MAVNKLKFLSLQETNIGQTIHHKFVCPSCKKAIRDKNLITIKGKIACRVCHYNASPVDRYLNKRFNLKA